MEAAGIFAYFGYHLSFDERINLIAEAGFSSTALWFGPEEGYVRYGLADTMVKLAADRGLSIAYVHASYRGCNDLWSSTVEIREAFLRRMREALNFCAGNHLGVLILHTSEGKSPPPPTPEGIETFSTLLEQAESLGVRLAVENTRSPLHLSRLLQSLDSSYLGLCYDSSHDHLYNPNPLALLETWGHRLFGTHLNDSDGRIDRHWLPREGGLDFSKIFAALRTTGYPGPHTLECVPRDRREPPEGFLARAFQRAREVGAALYPAEI